MPGVERGGHDARHDVVGSGEGPDGLSGRLARRRLFPGPRQRREDVADAGNLAVEVILRRQVGRGGQATAILTIVEGGFDGAVDQGLDRGVNVIQSNDSCVSCASFFL